MQPITFKCGCNSNNFMLNIRNYRKFVFVSIIHSGIKAISIEGINFIKKGYFKRIHRVKHSYKVRVKELLSLEGRHGWIHSSSFCSSLSSSFSSKELSVSAISSRESCKTLVSSFGERFSQDIQ